MVLPASGKTKTAGIFVLKLSKRKKAAFCSAVVNLQTADKKACKPEAAGSDAV